MDKRIIDKLKASEKDAVILLLYLTLMDVGDNYKCPICKVTKIDDDTFKISVDDEVIEKGLDKLFDVRRNPIEQIFTDE